MNCNYYREQVSLFIDNELDPGSQTRLFDHLASCSECHLFLDSVMKFKSMKNQEEVDFPSEVDTFLFEEIKRREYVYSLGKHGLEVKPPFWQRRVALSVPALTAIIAAIIIGVSTLFVNVFTLGSQPRVQQVQNLPDEKKVERQDVIVYGVPGITVYGQVAKTAKSNL